METMALDADAARAITTRIREQADQLWQLIVAAYEGRAWAALGYSSWEEYCKNEFGGVHLRLPRPERQELMRGLRSSGLSLRAIAAATGYDKHTVSRDLSCVNTKVIVPKSPRGRCQQRRSFADNFWRVSYDLARMGDKIAKLSGDGDFGNSRERIIETSLPDLLRARAALDEVITKLEGALV